MTSADDRSDPEHGARNTGPQDARANRLAAQLRANLMKRKAQARARARQDGDAGSDQDTSG